MNNMDRRQTCEILDAPPKDRRNWPVAEDFQGREEIVKWRDMQQSIYKVHEAQDRGHNKYGTSFVLRREHEKRPIVFLRALSSLAHAL